MANPKKVTVDTNVWLSALYFSGKPAKIVNLIEDNQVVSITSSFILNELKEKMIVKFQTPSFAANATISYIKSISEVVSLKDMDFGLRDVDDNSVLETAVMGKCDFLITGDKDLLTLKEYQQIQIVTPAQFLNKYTSY